MLYLCVPHVCILINTSPYWCWPEKEDVLWERLTKSSFLCREFRIMRHSCYACKLHMFASSWLLVYTSPEEKEDVLIERLTKLSFYLYGEFMVMLAHSACITNTQIAKSFLLPWTVSTLVRAKCEPLNKYDRLARVRKRCKAVFFIF